MRPVVSLVSLCILPLLGLGCEPALDAAMSIPPIEAEPEAAEPEAAEPEAAEPEAAEPEAPEPPAEPNACNTAPELDEQTETGWRLRREVQHDQLIGHELCAPGDRPLNGLELIGRFTAQRTGVHRFVGRGWIAHFYRMDAACERATVCGDDPTLGRRKELLIRLEAGEEAVLVADSVLEQEPRLVTIEVFEPAEDGEACGPFTGICVDGLACYCVSGNGCGDQQRCEPAAPPEVRQGLAVQVEGGINVDGLIFDENDDLGAAWIHVGDDRVGPYPLYNTGRRFGQHVRTQLRPESVTLELLDVAGERVMVELPVVPQPVRGDGEACDTEVRRDRCLEGSVCDMARCRINHVPTIDDVWMDTRALGESEQLTVRMIISDLDSDFSAVTLTSPEDPRGSTLEIVHQSRQADGTLLVLATSFVVPQGPLTLTPHDVWTAGTPRVAEPGRVYAAALDEPCDWGGAVACADGTVCETDDQGWQPRLEAWCTVPERACQNDAEIGTLGTDMPLALQGPTLQLATECGEGAAPAELVAFTAESAGQWRFTLTSQDRIASNLSVRRHCNVREEAVCAEARLVEEGPVVVELDLEADERITLVVSGRYGGRIQALQAERLAP